MFAIAAVLMELIFFIRKTEVQEVWPFRWRSLGSVGSRRLSAIPQEPAPSASSPLVERSLLAKSACRSNSNTVSLSGELIVNGVIDG
ncbi:MAG: hypothetical protein LBJ64_05290 [Deltaproteobacteria bacterium]|jgi:hypothetical protein|nr:hypothetical protein [Deltaproteobacteria bacterium]